MPKKKTSENKGFMGHLFAFINRDLSEVNFQNIVEVGIEYLQLLYFSKEGMNLSDYKEKYSLFADTPLESSDDGLEEIKKHLSGVQTYIRKVLTNLIEKENPSPIEQRGKRVISVIGDRFIETFETKEVPLDDFDLNTEKQRIKALLSDHIINEGLEPDKFALCDRPTCNNYFYRSSRGQRQTSCSNTCRSAMRMQDKRDKDKKKKGK